MAKSKATTPKKAAAKAPKPVKAESTKTPPAVFNLLASGSTVLASAQEALMRQRAKSRVNFSPTSLRGLGSVVREGITLEHFLFQYLFARRSLPVATILEIIGKEGVGKTTLAWYFAGQWARQNIMTGYLETETKPMDSAQIKRILDPNRGVSEQIFGNAIGHMEAREITQSIKETEDFVHRLRGRGAFKKEGGLIPQHIPIGLIFDTWSKLMNPAKAVGRIAYGGFDDPKLVAKKFEEVGEGSNLQHAKLMSEWCRTLPAFMDPYTGNNVFMMILSHQTEKIDMSGGRGGPQLPSSVLDMFNKNRIGGRGMNQNAAFQLIAAHEGLAKNAAKETTGKYVKIRMDKNSYGPNNRVIKFELRDVYTSDTATVLEEPLRLDEALADMFATDGVLGTTVERGLYSCKALGLTAVDGVKLSRAFHSNPELMASVGRHYQIAGYEDEATAAIITPPPPPPPILDPGMPPQEAPARPPTADSEEPSTDEQDPAADE